MKNVYLFKGFFIALMFALLTSCAGLNVKNNAALELTLKVAVMELIEKEDIAPADVIDTVGSAVNFLDKNSSAKVSDLMAHVRSKVSWDKLTISQYILINAILDGIEERIVTEVNKGLLSEDTVATVKEVLRWVEEAAMLASSRQ